jgi:menaquinone-dependent protoporphyrinogen oxidase
MTLPPDVTRPIGVYFATREGHSRHVAEHVTAALRARGLAVILANVADDGRRIIFDELGMVIAVASIHGGKHEREMIDFARRHAEALSRKPSIFVSVSLTEATAENEALPFDARVAAAEEVQRTVARFLEETGWHPQRVLPVAGCVAYSKYGLLKRFIMKRIVAGKGGPTDTTRDHELTDWEALDRFVGDAVAHAEQHGAGLKHV